ncbi:MAG TPA: FliA/WhiG family RNA polymerase sigma factor [Defluviitoga sp.]|nr:FliA/WhiG family RNA polymerase sigma factor [Defluviitoga sp.]HOP24891.1 FliA/WhiG family RNA polymerase sigma factor [Defluviitoga sp.]HPZ28786.1 FliA/WhiG family RNA polymerase sigma factor [Defluviitoga sp.]HQD62871.1 FliA/WhiG family RNA polymerase sigma factor [Defluviitoga sp.]
MKYNFDEEQLVLDYLPKIKYMALNLKSTLPKNVELDDLIQEGIIGLLQSYRKFDPKKGASFNTYATKRIKGAMIDYLRKIDWLPKETRSLIKKYEDLVYECGEDEYLDDKMIAEKLNIDENDVDKIKFSIAKRQILQLDGYFFDNDEGNWYVEKDESNDPEVIAYKEIFKEKLKSCIEQLPQREQLILSLYYDDNLTFREIGEILEISESRVSQIHSQILIKLKKMIEE